MYNYKLDSKLPTNLIAAFVIGVLSSYPSILPTTYALRKNPSYDLYKKAHLENMQQQLPLVYGILHVILFYFINNFLPENLRTYWLLGFIIGLIYPTLGTLGDHPRQVYGLTSVPKLYFSAQLMYLFFYGVVINFIFTNICTS